MERRKAVFKIQSEIARSSRRFLEKEGFTEMLPPIFEMFTDTGIGDADFFEIDYYGKRYKLMSALTIHKPILVTQFGDIFSFMPCSRKEYTNSGRHLSQFYQIEVEMEGDMENAMSKLEDMIKYVVDDVKESCQEELGVLGRDIGDMETPFKRITYSQFLKDAEKAGFDSGDNGITWDLEKKMSEHIEKPFFITRFPTKIISDRGFLYKTDGDTLLDFDLILPEGHGEVSSGSEREFEYEKIARKIDPSQINSFKSYLDIIKSGLKPTSGFGVGVERLTKFICDLGDISEASLFPKIPGRKLGEEMKNE